MAIFDQPQLRDPSTDFHETNSRTRPRTQGWCEQITSLTHESFYPFLFVSSPGPQVASLDTPHVNTYLLCIGWSYLLHTWEVTFEATHNYLGTNCLPCQRRLPSNGSKILGFMTSLTTYCSIANIWNWWTRSSQGPCDVTHITFPDTSTRYTGCKSTNNL